MSCSGYRQCLWQTLWITQHVESCSVLPIQAGTQTHSHNLSPHLHSQSIWVMCHEKSHQRSYHRLTFPHSAFELRREKSHAWEKKGFSLQPANTKLHTHTHSVCKIIRQLWVWGDGTSGAGECGTGYGSLWCDCKAERKSGLIRPTDQGLTRQTPSNML